MCEQRECSACSPLIRLKRSEPILEQVAVPDVTRAALLGQDNRLRQTLDLLSRLDAILDVPLDTIARMNSSEGGTFTSRPSSSANRARTSVEVISSAFFSPPASTVVASYEAADQPTCDSLRRRFRIPDALHGIQIRTCQHSGA